MSHQKSLQRQLAFKTIHNVSVSKMGQAILKKNPYETRILTDKLEDIEFHQRKWKNDFCGKVNDTRQDYKQTRSMESFSGVASYRGAKGGKMYFNATQQRLSGKPTEGFYQHPGQTTETETTRHKESTRGLARKEDNLASVAGKKKLTLTTDIKMYLGDKMFRVKRDAQDRGQGSVTPQCMTPFIHHSYTECSHRTATGDVTKWQKCKTCASVVAQKQAESQEKVVCVSTHPSRQENKALPKNITTKESCSVRTCSSTQKQNNILSTRLGEFILKRRVVSGFLKREKISNLVNGNSQSRAGHNLSLSPVKDARFVGLQSLLVPITNNTTKSKDKVELRGSPRGL